MINLLPPQKKEELKQEENLKLIVFMGFLVLASFICFALLLFSIRISISGEAESQRILYEQAEKAFQDSQLQALEEKTAELNEKLVKLDSFYKKQPKFSQAVENISKSLPQGLSFTSLTLNHQEKVMFCSVFGFSPTRAGLLELKGNLEEEKNFYEVNFPSSNWVKSESINFSVSFKIK